MFSKVKIYFWRTKGGAKVDFIVYKNQDCFYPIEVKYQNFIKPTVSRSFRSFIDAYQPKKGFIVTINFTETLMLGEIQIYFIPLTKLDKIFVAFSWK